MSILKYLIPVIPNDLSSNEEVNTTFRTEMKSVSVTYIKAITTHEE